MEKNDKTIYYLRFSEGNEIKTLKFCDFDSMLYLINQFELDGKQYVIVKKQEKAYKHIVKALLDFEI